MTVAVWEEISEADTRPVDGYQTSNVFGIWTQDLSAPAAVTSPQQCCWERRPLCFKFEANNSKASSLMWKSTSTCVLDPFGNGLSRSL